MTQLASDVSPPCSQGTTWCTSHQDGWTAATGAAAVAGCDRPPQPVGDHAGGSPDVQGLALAVEHDRHDRGVAAQHPQRLGAQRAAEVQARRRGPGSPDPPGARARSGVGAVRHRAGTSAWSSTYPHASASASACRLRLRALVVGVGGTGLRVDHRGDRVEHRGVVEMPLQCATGPATEALQVHLVDRIRRAVVGLGSVLVQRVDQSAAPLQQLRRACTGRRGPPARLRHPTRPWATTAARTGWPAPARSPRHVASSQLPSANCCAVVGNLAGSTAPSSPVRGQTSSATFTRRRASARSQPMRSATAVTALRYPRSANVPRRNKSATTADDDLIQPPCHTFADGEHGKQIVSCRGRSARCG